jgi:hypothetical protein
MIASRRWARATGPLIWVRSPSGPRWASRSDITERSFVSGAVVSRQYWPAIPHIMVKVGGVGLKRCEGSVRFKKNPVWVKCNAA